MLKCYGCGKGFAAGNEAVEFSLVRALLGEKSGQVGMYAHPSNPENEKEYVHPDPSCLEASFGPMVETNFMWDIMAKQVQQQMYEEEKERDPADYDMPEDQYELYEIIIEDPPYCLWCKQKRTVWCNFSEGIVVHYCFACIKMWDLEENQIYWDTEDEKYYIWES